MLKNNADSKHHKTQLGRHDARELQRRAADDAHQDADSFASKGWPQNNKGAGPSELGLVAELFCPRRQRSGPDAPEGIEGHLKHSVGGATSDDLLDIFLTARAEALSAQSVRIFRDNRTWSGKYVDWMKQVL